MKVLLSIVAISMLQTLISATVCTKDFGQYVGQQAYDCCIHLGGTPTVTLFGCSYGQCRKLSCDLSDENSKKWDCYSGHLGSLSNCLPFSEYMKTCTEDEINNGFKCPFTKSTSNM
ncbi:hypothetical protein BJ944DRAFT_264916 [Cunninghamella echinulata]|nr:hypothetical protein BJ944DRAFT_264916 [Cunninghamella echinulata]